MTSTGQDGEDGGTPAFQNATVEESDDIDDDLDESYVSASSSNDQDESGAGGGRLSVVKEKLSGTDPASEEEEEQTGPMMAELVDGAEVLFIDEAAGRKNLYEFDLVLLTAPAYPEPAVIKCNTSFEVPEGSVLSEAKSPSLVKYGKKRVTARAYALAPPERAEEVPRDQREDVPEEISGETIPRRKIQNVNFYNRIVKAASD